MTQFYDFFKYHQETKHSYYSVRAFPNRLDWNNQPSTFKNYPKEYERIDINTNLDNHNFLYLTAGINVKKVYPGVEYFLRINPSAGALYPNEIYFQARNEEGFEDGIYHFEVSSSSATLLYKLNKEEGIEANLNLDKSYNGFIFFISSIYFRSSWKYKNRAFRYCLLDAGHILGSLEASSYLYNKSFSILYDFDRNKINKLFNFDNKEFFTSIVLCGKVFDELKKPLSLNLPKVDGHKTNENNSDDIFEKNELIENAYKLSSKINNKIVQLGKPNFIYNKELFKETIFKRRSIREFSNKSISKAQYESIINILNQIVSSDCDEKIDIFYVINRVENMPIGLYKNKKLIKQGDFKSKAGYLCLEQDLGKSSAITFYLTSKDKNYQALYQKAGILGHRLYLACNYLKISCSGIGAYYDDEVCEFIDENCMVLYSLAIGN
ncbi:SagB family peptide dehydrogenase [Malaciobacter sp. WC5094]